MSCISMTKKKQFKSIGHKNLPGMLESVGLTANDSAVYIYLLESGASMTGSKIALVNGLHRQYVYNSLSKLEKMGLVEFIEDGNKLRCRALPPVQITKLAQKKLSEAEDIEKELKTISTVGAEQDFEVYMGERQVRDYETRLVENLPLNTEQYIIGGSSDIFVKFFGEQYYELALTTNKKGLKSYYIGCPEEMPWPQTCKEAHNNFDYVILDSLPRTVVSTVVRFDTVAMYSMIAPPLVYVIKSKRVADDYKKFFDMLWNMAKKKK